METRLKNHIDIIFGNMPQTAQTQEIKEEMLQNLIDKYNDLVSQGKDPEAAYSITIASIGDISGLFDNNKDTDKEALQKQKNKSAILLAISVMLFILSPMPVVMLEEIGFETLGILLMFSMIAIGAGLIIYRGIALHSRPKNNETMVNEFRQWQEGNPSKKSKLGAVSGIIWSIAVIVYFILSFATYAWHITWLVFLIAVAVQQIVRLIMTLKD